MAVNPVGPFVLRAAPSYAYIGCGSTNYLLSSYLLRTLFASEVINTLSILPCAVAVAVEQVPLCGLLLGRRAMCSVAHDRKNQPINQS